MIFLPIVSKIIGILNDKASPGQIGAGFALGAMIGLIPGFTLLSLFILIIVFLLNVNMTAAFLAIPIFKLAGYIVDPLSDQIGLTFLTRMPPLSPLWTALYNLPFIPFTRFNNTVVLGNFILGIALFIPIALAVRKFVLVYRLKWRDRIERTRVMQMYRASKLYDLWQTINRFRQG